MSKLYERIEALCAERETNITEMCRRSGASRGSLTDLKMGRTNGLNTKTIEKIAAFFGVSVGYLLGTEEQKKPADPKVDRLSKAGYEELTPENKAVIDSLIEKLLKSQAGE